MAWRLARELRRLRGAAVRAEEEERELVRELDRNLHLVVEEHDLVPTWVMVRARPSAPLSAVEGELRERVLELARDGLTRVRLARALAFRFWGSAVRGGRVLMYSAHEVVVFDLSRASSDVVWLGWYEDEGELARDIRRSAGSGWPWKRMAEEVGAVVEAVEGLRRRGVEELREAAALCKLIS